MWVPVITLRSHQAQGFEESRLVHPCSPFETLLRPNVDPELRTHSNLSTFSLLVCKVSSFDVKK